MPVTNGGTPHLESDHLVSRSLGPGLAAWPLGRMLVVVFAICLMAWLVVIAYFVDF